MACLVGYRHLLTRVPSGEGGVSTPKWGGGGRVIQYWLSSVYVPPSF